MEQNDKNIDKELFLEKFEQLSLKVEQLTDEISQLKHKIDNQNKINRTFGLKAIQNSEPLDFAKNIQGIGSPTKNYILSIRSITEEWKGRKNDILITVRQQDTETHMDLKALGIRIPIKEVRTIRDLSKEILSLLFISCQLKSIEINDILREILGEINQDSNKMLQEIKKKMAFPTQ